MTSNNDKDEIYKFSFDGITLGEAYRQYRKLLLDSVRGHDAAVDADAVEPVADRMDCRPGGSVLDRLPNGAHEQGQHE